MPHGGRVPNTRESAKPATSTTTTYATARAQILNQGARQVGTERNGTERSASSSVLGFCAARRRGPDFDFWRVRAGSDASPPFVDRAPPPPPDGGEGLPRRQACVVAEADSWRRPKKKRLRPTARLSAVMMDETPHSESIGVPFFSRHRVRTVSLFYRRGRG
jgi:hypothetical protein